MLNCRSSKNVGSLNHLIKELRKYKKSVESKKPAKIEREMGMKAWLSGIVPIAAMVMMECLDVGLVTLSKAAMSRGMNHFVFVVYYNALASLIFSLLSFIFHRSLCLSLSISVQARNKTKFSFLVLLSALSFGFAEQRGPLSLSLTSVNSSFSAFLGQLLYPCIQLLLVGSEVDLLSFVVEVG